MLSLDAAEALYGVVANVDWSEQTKEWVVAASRARDLYHQALNEAYPAVGTPDVSRPIEARVLRVLRSDYQMLIHVVTDRLVALDEAFGPETP